MRETEKVIGYRQRHWNTFISSFLVEMLQVVQNKVNKSEKNQFHVSGKAPTKMLQVFYKQHLKKGNLRGNFFFKLRILMLSILTR